MAKSALLALAHAIDTDLSLTAPEAHTKNIRIELKEGP